MQVGLRTNYTYRPKVQPRVNRKNRVSNYVLSKLRVVLFSLVMGLSGCFVTYNNTSFENGSSKYAKIINKLKRKIQYEPDSRRIKKYRLKLGSTYLGRADYDKALAVYKTILAKYPGEHGVQYRVAFIYYKQRKYQKAFDNLIVLEKSSAKFRNRLDLQIALAEFNIKLGRYEKAIKRFNLLRGLAARGMVPGTYGDYANLKIGEIYFMQKKYNQALKAFSTVKIRRYRRMSHYFLAEIYLMRKDYVKANQMFVNFVVKLRHKNHGKALNALYRIGQIYAAAYPNNPRMLERAYRILGVYAPELKHLIPYLNEFFKNKPSALKKIHSYDDQGKVRTFVFSRDGRLQNIIPGPVKVIGKDLLARYPNGVKLIFRNFSKTLWKNFHILKCLHDLPGFFKGLKTIEIMDEIMPGAKGDYNARLKAIRLFSDSGLETMAHELFHHWDISMPGGPNDPSKVFYGISWRTRKKCFAIPIILPSFCKVKVVRVDDKNDFLGFGMDNVLEDIAHFGESYYTYGKKVRVYVRKQMKRGNFEPAAKYLFIKHMTPVNGREFGRGLKLNAREVKRKLARWLRRHPGSVKEYTIKTIRRF